MDKEVPDARLPAQQKQLGWTEQSKVVGNTARVGLRRRSHLAVSTFGKKAWIPKSESVGD